MHNSHTKLKKLIPTNDDKHQYFPLSNWHTKNVCIHDFLLLYIKWKILLCIHCIMFGTRCRHITNLTNHSISWYFSWNYKRAFILKLSYYFNSPVMFYTAVWIPSKARFSTFTFLDRSKSAAQNKIRTTFAKI